MAAVDKYPSNIEVADTAYVPAAQAQGDVEVTLVQTIEVASGDDNDSIYRIFRNVPSSFVPTQFNVESDAITSGNDWNVGLYKPNLGTVVDENILADALDLSSAVKGFTAKNGLDAVAIENIGVKPLWELAGQTLGSQDPMFDIGLKGVAVGSADGTIKCILRGFMR